MSVRVIDPLTVDPASSTARVLGALAEHGIVAEVVEFAAGTKTSADAAAAIGCGIAQIAKSIVFRGKSSDLPVIAILSGAHRACERKIAAAIGEAVGKADASFVRDRTGFAIGGVAPLGHAGEVRLLLDTALLELDPLWAAAGTPNTVFSLSPADLRRLPQAQICEVRES